jgi:hypothetical protein
VPSQESSATETTPTAAPVIEPSSLLPDIEFLPDLTIGIDDTPVVEAPPLTLSNSGDQWPFIDITNEDLLLIPSLGKNIEILSVEDLSPEEQAYLAGTTPMPTPTPASTPQSQPSVSAPSPVPDTSTAQGAKNQGVLLQKIKNAWDRFVAWFVSN